MSAPLTSHTVKLTPAQAATLRVYLRDHDFVFREVPYSEFAAAKEQINFAWLHVGEAGLSLLPLLALIVEEPVNVGREQRHFDAFELAFDR